MAGNERVKQKKCRICKKLFPPMRPFQAWCSFDCAILLVKQKEQQKQRKERKDAKERAKTRKQWIKEAQAACNAYIRLRDKDEPCISCGRFHQGQYHAGHYRATSVAPSLRFDEQNIHKQCQPCNCHKHGNLLEYRLGLINKIGIEKVVWLEGPQEPKHYSIEDLKEIKAKYMRLVKELNKG